MDDRDGAYVAQLAEQLVARAAPGSVLADDLQRVGGLVAVVQKAKRESGWRRWLRAGVWGHGGR